jgi:transcriptional regulator with PAS, ATPase and Fis domain
MIFMTPNEKLLSSEHLSFSMNPQSRDPELSIEIDSGPLSDQLDRFEKTILVEKLNTMKGNKSLTAQKLGISLRSLYYKLDKYNLQ